MTVGEALTEARHQAGLSVEELSERTKIRGTVIRSIEQDDFEACGGDLYARGYVRALAGAVGIDAQPLIREFDLKRSSGANEGASGPVGRQAESYPSAIPQETAQTSSGWPGIAETRTSSDLPTVPEAPPSQQPPAQQPPAQQSPVQQGPVREAPGEQAQVPPADLYATRYDLPAVTADPAVTSYDLPRVPDVPPAAEPPTAEFAATEYPSSEFPVLMPPVPGSAAAPPAVPLDGAKTRYDLTAVPREPSPEESEDLMAAGYDLGPAEKPAGANDGTRILPAIDSGQAPPPAATAWPASGQASPPRKNRRGLFVVAAAVVVVAVGALGFSLASRGGGTAVGAGPSANTSAARASASAAARAKADAAARASASTAKASASATARAGSQPVTTLSVASVMAFGPNGTADGDDPGNAANAVAANPSSPWTTQWYNTAKFGMLKHGTGLLLDLGGHVTVTTVRLDLSPYQGADLQLRVGNVEALPDLHVAATANNVGGVLKLTLHHPAAARYLLIWFTELPPNGAGRYQETVSHVLVTGRR